MRVPLAEDLKVAYPQCDPPQSKREFEALLSYPDYVEDPSRVGHVILDPSWVQYNMVLEWFPILGMRYVNRLMVIPLWRALSEIDSHPDPAIQDYIKPKQCGLFSPRHKMSDPSRSLSTHAYGLALDLNWLQNRYGKSGTIRAVMGIVEIFKRHGFNWGGDWSTLDDMHLQWCGNNI